MCVYVYKHEIEFVQKGEASMASPIDSSMTPIMKNE